MIGVGPLIQGLIDKYADPFVLPGYTKVQTRLFRGEIVLENLRLKPEFFSQVENALTSRNVDLFAHGVEIQSGVVQRVVVKFPVGNWFSGRWSINAQGVNIEGSTCSESQKARLAKLAKNVAIRCETERRRRQEQESERSQDTAKRWTTSPVDGGDSLAARIDKHARQHLDISIDDIQVVLRLHHEVHRANFDPVWRASVKNLVVDIGAGELSIPAPLKDMMGGMRKKHPTPPNTAKFVTEEKTTVSLHGLHFDVVDLAELDVDNQAPAFEMTFEQTGFILHIHKTVWDQDVIDPKEPGGTEFIHCSLPDGFKVDVRWKPSLVRMMIRTLHEMFEAVACALPEFQDFRNVPCSPVERKEMAETWITRYLSLLRKRRVLLCEQSSFYGASTLASMLSCHEPACGSAGAASVEDELLAGYELTEEEKLDLANIERKLPVEMIVDIRELVENDCQDTSYGDIKSIVPSYRWCWSAWRHYEVSLHFGSLFEVNVDESVVLRFCPNKHMALIRDVPGDWQIKSSVTFAAFLPQSLERWALIHKANVGMSWNRVDPMDIELRAGVPVFSLSTEVFESLQSLARKIADSKPWTWYELRIIWKEFGIMNRTWEYNIIAEAESFRLNTTEEMFNLRVDMPRISSRTPIGFSKDAITGSLKITTGYTRAYLIRADCELDLLTLCKFECDVTSLDGLSLQVITDKVSVTSFPLMTASFVTKLCEMKRAFKVQLDYLSTVMRSRSLLTFVAANFWPFKVAITVPLRVNICDALSPYLRCDFDDNQILMSGHTYGSDDVSLLSRSRFELVLHGMKFDVSYIDDTTGIFEPFIEETVANCEIVLILPDSSRTSQLTVDFTFSQILNVNITAAFIRVAQSLHVAWGPFATAAMNRSLKPLKEIPEGKLAILNLCGKTVLGSRKTMVTNECQAIVKLQSVFRRLKVRNASLVDFETISDQSAPVPRVKWNIQHPIDSTHPRKASSILSGQSSPPMLKASPLQSQSSNFALRSPNLRRSSSSPLPDMPSDFLSLPLKSGGSPHKNVLSGTPHQMALSTLSTIQLPRQRTKTLTPLLLKRGVAHDLDGDYPIPSSHEKQPLIIVPTQWLRLDFRRISRKFGAPKFRSLHHEMMSMWRSGSQAPALSPAQKTVDEDPIHDDHDDGNRAALPAYVSSPPHANDNTSKGKRSFFPFSSWVGNSCMLKFHSRSESKELNVQDVRLTMDEPMVEPVHTCTVNPFARMMEPVSTQEDKDIMDVGTAYVIETMFPTITDRLILIRGPICVFNATTLNLSLFTSGNSFVCSDFSYLGGDCPFDPAVYDIPAFDPAAEFSPGAFASLQPSDRNADKTMNIAIGYGGHPPAPLMSFDKELLEVTPQYFVWSHTNKRVMSNCILYDIVFTPSLVLRNTTPLPLEFRVGNWSEIIPSNETYHIYQKLPAKREIQFRFNHWEWSKTTPLPMLHSQVTSLSGDWIIVPRYITKSKRHAHVLVNLRVRDSVVVFGCPSWASLQRTDMALGDRIELQNSAGKPYPKLNEELAGEEGPAASFPMSRIPLAYTFSEIFGGHLKREVTEGNITQVWLLDGTNDNYILFYSWDNAVRMIQKYWRKRKTEGCCHCVSDQRGSRRVALPIAKALLGPQQIAVQGTLYGFSFFPLSVSSHEMPKFAGDSGASVEATMTLIQPGIQITNCLTTDLFMKQVDHNDNSVGMTLIAPQRTQAAWLWLRHKQIHVGNGETWSAPINLDINNISAGYYSLAIPVKHGEPMVWGLSLSDVDGVLSLQVKPRACCEVRVLDSAKEDVKRVACTTDSLFGTPATFSCMVHPFHETRMPVGYFRPFDNAHGNVLMLTLELPTVEVTVHIELASQKTYCVLEPLADRVWSKDPRTVLSVQVQRQAEGLAIIEIGELVNVDLTNSSEIQCICGKCSLVLSFDGTQTSRESAGDSNFMSKVHYPKRRASLSDVSMLESVTYGNSLECQNPLCKTLLRRPTERLDFKFIAQHIYSRVRSKRSLVGGSPKSSASKIKPISDDAIFKRLPEVSIAFFTQLMDSSWLEHLHVRCLVLVSAIGVSVVSKQQRRELCYLNISSTEVIAEIPHGLCHSHCVTLLIGAIRLDSQLQDSLHQTVFASIAPPNETTRPLRPAIEFVAHRVYVSAPGLFFKRISLMCSHRFEVCLDEHIINALSYFAHEVSSSLRQTDDCGADKKKDATSGSKHHLRTSRAASDWMDTARHYATLATPKIVAQDIMLPFMPPVVPLVLSIKEFRVRPLHVTLWCSLRLDRMRFVPQFIVRIIRMFTLWDAAVSLRGAVARSREQHLRSWEGSLHAFISLLVRKYLYKDLVRAGFQLLRNSNVFNLLKSPVKSSRWAFEKLRNAGYALVKNVTGKETTKKITKGSAFKDAAPLRHPRILLAADQLVSYTSTLLPHGILVHQHALRLEQPSILDQIQLCYLLTRTEAVILSEDHVAIVDLNKRKGKGTRVLGFFLWIDLRMVNFQECNDRTHEIAFLHKNGLYFRWKIDDLPTNQRRALERAISRKTQ
eukprot:GEMP01000182.1.p1 GENE.GEMP01000182.1~~GEMP01000182.1.p1  ORF type:complete len:2511 (+),score=422.82 GEMP01000182.1:33-7565(+)